MRTHIPCTVHTPASSMSQHKISAGLNVALDHHHLLAALGSRGQLCWAASLLGPPVIIAGLHCLSCCLHVLQRPQTWSFPASSAAAVCHTACQQCASSVPAATTHSLPSQQAGHITFCYAWLHSTSPCLLGMLSRLVKMVKAVSRLTPTRAWLQQCALSSA